MSEQLEERATEVIDEIESCLYQLCSQIDYGEISDIETYTESLTQSLENMAEFGYEISSNLKTLADALIPFRGIVTQELIDMAINIKETCEGGGSTDSIDPDDIEDLQSDTIIFEQKFNAFLLQLREIHAPNF